MKQNLMTSRETEKDAYNRGVLSGYAQLAGDEDSNTLYSTARGVRSLKPESTRPFSLSTICAIVSFTKLLTSVATLQCVDAGLLDLDKPVSDFDDDRNEAITVTNTTPITLRMLLSHTSGHEYDWFEPLLGKWRISRGELPWTGLNVEQKLTLPLVFQPGTAWAYGAGADWAGKMIERATGKTLEVFMAEKIWSPLRITDITFLPKGLADLTDRMATISALNDAGEGLAVDAPHFDILMGGTECISDGGAFASPEAYFTFLQAVFRCDSRLLKEESWRNFSGRNRNEGRMSPGTIAWVGYIDFEAGICGMAACQILPPMCPTIMDLHAQFQSGIYPKHGSSRWDDVSHVDMLE
ncbi:beta-lactamase/transpeptidase-like protein [Clohesyomyces aquaticus]|uniref:Beta-lactamase/transpeptidase-like protein n=1 Tax=Clohesyomyces aquaticus TaxID=1231657 RepID=A0A1Y2AAF1_9PLEO|nr:beta-lactamase/transpeptidase-like protein [Clohesyomyces aquaticus]